MRSWSVSIGRLFGVEVRIHLTFFVLPLFIFWTEYGAHGSANGPRDLALVGIILAGVIAHELGHMLAAARTGIMPKARSEERRVGKECRTVCRSRWSPYH